MGQKKGYTIMEVMIFLAVSSVIFFGAMRAIGGRQEQVQFAQAVREFEAKMSDIMNDVTVGYFPTNATLRCDIVANRPVIRAGTDARLGTSDDCIFIGKLIQFAPDGNASRMDIYSAVGKRYEDSVNLIPSSSIATAGVAALAEGGVAPGIVDATESYDLLYGLRINRVFRPLDAGTDYGMIGIFSQFGASGVSDSQSVQIGGIVGSEFDVTESDAINLINQVTDDQTRVGNVGFIQKNTGQGLIVCLESFNATKRASVSFGARGSATTVLNIDTFHPGCEP